MDEALVVAELTACGERCDAVELTGLPFAERPGGEGDDSAFDDD